MNNNDYCTMYILLYPMHPYVPTYTPQVATYYKHNTRIMSKKVKPNAVWNNNNNILTPEF